MPYGHIPECASKPLRWCYIVRAVCCTVHLHGVGNPSHVYRAQIKEWRIGRSGQCKQSASSLLRIASPGQYYTGSSPFLSIPWKFYTDLCAEAPGTEFISLPDPHHLWPDGSPQITWWCHERIVSSDLHPYMLSVWDMIGLKNLIVART